MVTKFSWEFSCSVTCRHSPRLLPPTKRRTKPLLIWLDIAAPLLPETDRRENGILYTNTLIGDNAVSTARSGFDAGNFSGMQVRDRRYPIVDSQTGTVMSLVRFGDPMAPLNKASLPMDRNGNEQKAPDTMVGASFVSEVFLISQGKIADINAYWIPSEGNVATPWPTGSVPVRDW